MMTAMQMIEMLDRNGVHYVTLTWATGNKVSQIYFLETNPYGETVIRVWFFGGKDSRAYSTSSEIAKNGELDLLAWYANDCEDYAEADLYKAEWH
jgi:hypothetical protein